MLITCLTSIILLANLANSQPIVDTIYGQVQGQTISTHYGVNVHSFHGIPFAKPPIGDLRFAKTENAEPWEDVFIADTLPNSCIQEQQGWLWITHPGWRKYSEDCLYLDVYVPEDMDPAEPYPVMVFFHGGAYQSGAMIQYPGHFYAARDVILVVPNYRLGIFGFVSTNDAVAAGNYGLYDQRQSLQWVQANIAYFGGDPDRVTIFGQSAGAGSVGLHMVSPLAEGLFNQVIEESGSDLNFWAFNWPASEPHTYGEGVAEELGCDIDTTENWIGCLREEDPWAIFNQSNPLTCNPGHFCLGFAPVVDGTAPILDPYVPDIPLEMRKRGEFAKVPTMTGYLTEDGALYTLAYIPEAMDGGFTREEFQHHLREDLLGMWAPQLTEKQLEDTFQAMDWFYAPWPYTNDTEMNRQAFNMMVTDGAFAASSDRQARFQSDAGVPTYQYVFGYRSNDSYGGLLNGTDWMKVFHSAELPYVFGWPLLQLSPEVRLDSRILIDIVSWNQDDIDYAEFVTDLWANFAKYGNPTPEPIQEPPFGNPPVTWEPYSTDGNFNSFYMAENIATIQDYRQQDMAFWREYLTYILERDFYDTEIKDDITKTRKSMSSDMFNMITEERLNLWLEGVSDEFSFE